MIVCLLNTNYYYRCHGNDVKGFSTLWDNVSMTRRALCLNYCNCYRGNALRG
jgi:hypothetical protein